jgi:glutamine synthetase
VSSSELTAHVCCDLGAIVRGRSVPSETLARSGQSSVGWVPANLALTPLGTLAEPSPFDATGDLRLRGELEQRVRVEIDGEGSASPLELVLCDITEIDGSPWPCCPRSFLRGALARLEEQLGLRALVSFEHEFQLLDDSPPALAFSLEAQRRAEPFPSRVFDALRQAGVRPQRLMSEYAPHQFEIPVEPAEGLLAADRAVIFREVVREVAWRNGTRASFAPLIDPEEAGNGAHIHLSLLDADGAPALFDAERPACLSELGASFAAGVLEHAGALRALTSASPLSAARLQPHRWSAGGVGLARQHREALLRVPPLLREPGAAQPASQLRLEYRAADASANPYLALGAIVLAGLDGVTRRLPEPPLLEGEPAQLEQAQAERFGLDALPDSLAASLEALAGDQTAREWIPQLLYDAYFALKRAELDGTTGLELDALCARYAAIY